ncbi:MAG: DinB family protein [Candidatus Limnocylindria bacterium]
MQHMSLLARMAVAEGRLAAFAEHPPPGLTDADPATGERWDAGQAWAHVAEFVPYWQGEIERVLAGAGAEPVPFGRTTEDPGRVGAIEAGRHEPPTEQMARLAGALMLLRRYLARLSEEQWSARGLHERRGEMTVAEILDRFVVSHLEEHADQLEKLAADSA